LTNPHTDPSKTEANPNKTPQTLKNPTNPKNGESSHKALSSNSFQRFLLMLATPFLLRVGMLLSFKMPFSETNQREAPTGLSIQRIKTCKYLKNQKRAEIFF
jgi:hypothetical protein